MLKNLETVSSESLFENPYWTYNFDRYIKPDGESGEYHYVNSRGATLIIPRKEKNTFIMIRQYRYLNKRISIEFPGGGIKAGLEAMQNAIEELKEEAGYEADNIFEIGKYNPYNGVTNEICRVFLAEKLKKCKSNPDSSEEFEIIELTTESILNKIEKGEIWDGMTLAAWSIYYFSERGR